MKSQWREVSLGCVLNERQEVPDPEDLLTGRIPIVNKIRFKDGTIELRRTGETRTRMILIRPGDLVISGINAYQGAIAVYDEREAEPIAATMHYSSYIPNRDEVVVKYLWWFLRSNEFRRTLEQQVPGGIKSELKAATFLQTVVRLPPKHEQGRIVARIEELATRVDEGRSLRQRAVKDAEAIYQSALTQITKEIPVNGTLERVLREKPRNGWSAKCDNVSAGTPVLSLSAVTGFEYNEAEYKTTSEPTSPGAHYWLERGDLLITRSNTPELVGHAAIYNGAPFPCIYPDLMIRLRVNEKCADVRFVHHFLQSVPVRAYITRNSKGTSPTMKKISQGTVLNIPFPSSLSLKEQQQIAAYLDGIQERVKELTRLQGNTAAELDALLPSILDKAFKGEL